MLTVTLEHREHITGQPSPSGPPVSGGLLPPGVALRVERLEWRALGGPWTARLAVSAVPPALDRLWRLTDLLRCGLTVHDERGPAWWGYISAVEIRAGAGGVRVSLDELATSAAARYRAFAPENGGGGTAGGPTRITPFVTDEVSARRYGVKQRVVRLGQAAESEAAAAARALLAQASQPRPRLSTRTVGEPGPRAVAPGPRAVIEARGWWETLDWKLAVEPRGRVANPRAGAEQKFGDPGQPMAAQRFSLNGGAWTAGEAWARLRRVGPPADAVRLELRADAGSAPGALTGSAEVPGALVPDEWGWVRFAFPQPLPLAAGTHWLVLSRSGALSSGQYYGVSADQGCALEGGEAWVYSGGAWAARVPPADLGFSIQGVEETTEQARRLLLPEQCGQFLRGSRIEAPSGVLAALYRPLDDAPRGRAALEALLARGTAAGERLLARVEPDRTARIYAQPGAAAAGLVIGADGQICKYGRPLALSEPPAGQWARLAALAPAGETHGMDKAVFIETCAWEEGRWRVGG